MGAHILPHHSSSADVQVADLAIAHQAFWKSYGKRGCLELGVSMGGCRRRGVKVVHDRGLSAGDGIPFLGRMLAGDAPAIDDDYLHRSAIGGYRIRSEEARRERGRPHVDADPTRPNRMHFHLLRTTLFLTWVIFRDDVISPAPVKDEWGGGGVDGFKERE